MPTITQLELEHLRLALTNLVELSASITNLRNTLSQVLEGAERMVGTIDQTVTRIEIREGEAAKGPPPL